VLYEMLAGRRAFEGAEVPDTLASVLTAAPEWAALPATTPAAIHRLLRRCLEKDRRKRLSDIADARLDIDEALSASPANGSIAPEARSALAGPSRFRRALPVVAAIVGAAGAALVLVPWGRPPTASPIVPLRLSVELGADAALPTTDAPFALSPDGTHLAFVARKSDGAEQLYVRRLDQFGASALSGTDGASGPFFSPDGQWLAFFADSKLKKVPVAGGAVLTLAEATNHRGGWWAEDGTIVFTPTNRVGLMRVSSVGGPVQPLTALRDGEITHRFPQMLPGDRAVLYTASTEVDIGADASLVVQPLPAGERIVVQRGGYFGRYLGSGHIVYVRDDTLFAVPFDPQRHAVHGPPARAVEGVTADASRGSAQFAVSQTGTLAFLPGRNEFDPRPMAWMDRAGTVATMRAVAEAWSNPEFSPDGQRVAVDIRRTGHRDIFVYEWGRDVLTRITSEDTNEEHPVWTPDGRRLVYRSFKSSTDPSGNTLSWRGADGTGEAQVLVQGKGALVPGSWHPTRSLLAYVVTTATSGGDVMILPVEGDDAGGWKAGRPTGFATSPVREADPAFSPDGQWLAYTSTVSGQSQVYVQPFPGPGPVTAVSSAGGTWPSWSRTHSALVFSGAGPDYRQLLMIAPYRVKGGVFRADKPRLWADRGPPLRMLSGQRNHALHPDGARVVRAPPADDELIERKHIALFLNFSDELRRVAPSQR
jgi:serine/threonine-protein kinase